MRIAIAGKGGTGKTTIAGTLARILGEDGGRVLAVDADTNPNLAAIVGLEPDRLREVGGLPPDLLQRMDEDGESRLVLTRPVAEVVSEFSAPGPGGVDLMLMGEVGHAGKGCMCRAHSSMRGFLGELVREPLPGRGAVILDMEAGLEHLSRGTGRHVEVMVAVVEPYYRALETGRRVVELARELEIGRVVVVANKVRDDGDREAVRVFLDRHGMELVGEIPFDPGLMEAERAGEPPILHDPHSPVVRAIRELSGRLVSGDSAEIGK